MLCRALSRGLGERAPGSGVIGISIIIPALSLVVLFCDLVMRSACCAIEAGQCGGGGRDGVGAL